MSEEAVEETTCHKKLVAAGRRHLAVKDYNAAVEVFARACDLLAAEFGESADQCAEAYLWYGKALLGLSREESAGAVLGDGVPGTGNADEDDDEENSEEEQNGEAEANSEVVEKVEEETEKEKEVTQNKDSAKKSEAESTTKDEELASSSNNVDGEPATSNRDDDAVDESTMNMETDGDDIDNLQLAWEMLDLSRSILERRLGVGGEAAAAAKALLADAHLALGEVALESETYDKAVIDMQSCLELQKELYRSDDRRIAETHYQIGLANSLASNFEDAITHFKNAANILESRIKMLEFPTADSGDATVKKLAASDSSYSVEAEIKELKELLPEIQEKIQDMMDYKAETIRRVREALCPTNGAESKPGGSPSFTSSSSGPSSSTAKPVSDISHLVRRKRKPSEEDDKQPAKRTNTST